MYVSVATISLNSNYTSNNGALQFDDGREPELLRVILHHPSVNQLWGNSRKVLDVIDEFGRTRKYLMNISACNKSKTIVDLIKALKLQVLAEIGECVDYSAIVSRYVYNGCRQVKRPT